MAVGKNGSDANKKFVDGIIPVRYLLLCVAGVFLFLCGVWLGWIGHDVQDTPPSVRENGFTYIHPLLLCNISPLPQNEDAGLTSVLRSYINSSSVKNVGVYYLNPTANKWAGVNENESFSPASMLKVPIMTAVLRATEVQPDFLSHRITYSGATDYNKTEDIKPPHRLVPGQSYTVDELLSSMIEYSDNNATDMLYNLLPAAQFKNIFTDLGIEAPTINGPVDFMSPKTFTLFLRILYNSSYLSRELSEKALTLMAYPDFPQGLQSGVPAGVTVAQKFGERKVVSGTGTTMELHDCGIVYAPEPYFLCVMTRGNNFDTLAKEIGDISKLVYDNR